jgi:hypothetical protein
VPDVRVCAAAPPVPMLQHWASCLTAALAVRERFGDEELRRFARPVEGIVPGLPSLLGLPA